MVVLNPIVDFDILKGHHDAADFVFVRYFAFVEIRVEILYKLHENSGRDVARSKDRSCFVTFMVLDGSHVRQGRCGLRGRHCKTFV